jgi:hypothetical protein
VQQVLGGGVQHAVRHAAALRQLQPHHERVLDVGTRVLQHARERLHTRVRMAPVAASMRV